jgi:hypothetical protein
VKTETRSNFHRSIRRVPGVAARHVFDAPNYQRHPAGLMDDAEASAGFRVKIFMEQDQALPIGIVQEAFVFA